MSRMLSDMIENKIKELKCDPDLEMVLRLLKEYSEITSGIWREIMNEREEHRKEEIDE